MIDKEISFSLEGNDGVFTKLEHATYPSYFHFKFDDSVVNSRARAYNGSHYDKESLSISEQITFLIKPAEDSLRLKVIKFNASMLKLAKEKPDVRLKQSNKMVAEIAYSSLSLRRDTSLSETDGFVLTSHISQSDDSSYSFGISLLMNPSAWDALLADYEAKKLCPVGIEFQLDNLLSAEPENQFAEQYMLNGELYYGNLICFYNSKPEVERDNLSVKSEEHSSNKALVQAIDDLKKSIDNAHITLLSRLQLIGSNLKYVITTLIVIAVVIAFK